MNQTAFFGGFFGGATGVSLSHSIDTVRIVYQSNPEIKSLNESYRYIKKTSGYGGFFKGMSYPIIGIGLEKCIVFGTYENVKNLGIFNNNYFNIFSAGIVSGLFCTSIVTPIEKVKILLQNNKKTSFTKLIKKNGIQSLYRGWSATLFREVPGYGIYFTTYEFLKKNVTNNITPLHTLIFGAMSGVSSWIFIYPADPIKTIMQDRSYSLSQSFKYIFKNNGIQGFYRGFSLGILRALPLHAGVFLGYETFINFFN
eukprot:TRINITY_DN11624_c0_g1_i1.p1 TRINITY_DN11624_c0_g1~~TRINITY_DN11624_c0_g1_i1.p1  ORF type:complete len:255 (-),score=54.67 TRINITY_DN11624_c0_g1_i1:116-880(-)